MLRSDVAFEELRFLGLTATELETLELLTHAETESYELHVLRIARATGPAGRLARVVKLADLDDHLAHAVCPAGAPPYAWARRRIARAQARRGDRTRRDPSRAPADGAAALRRRVGPGDRPAPGPRRTPSPRPRARRGAAVRMSRA